MSQRFLTVDVFAQAHGHQTSGSMGVIGRADGDRINFRMHFFKHFAEIFVFFCFWKLLGLGVEVTEINVTNRNDIPEIACLINITRALAADANAGKGDTFIGPKNAFREKIKGKSRGRGSAQEGSPGNVGFGVSLFHGLFRFGISHY